MDRNKGVKYAAAAYSAQVLRGGGLETLARERERERWIRLSKYNVIGIHGFERVILSLEGPLQDWSELFSRRGREGRIYETSLERRRRRRRDGSNR